MARLNDDERKLLAELQARDAEPDADEEFEIEVYDTTAGKGARIPFSKGKNWLFDTFGIGDAPAAAGGEGGTGGDAPAAGAGGEGVGKGAGGGTGYFGRK
jgi:hypothetical protein